MTLPLLVLLTGPGSVTEKRGSLQARSVAAGAGRKARVTGVCTMHRLRFTLALALICGFCAAVGSEARAQAPEIVSVMKIWDRAPHSAFTDLVRWRGKWH